VAAALLSKLVIPAQAGIQVRCAMVIAEWPQKADQDRRDDRSASRLDSGLRRNDELEKGDRPM